jgi:predicted DNA-binding ribbon-helix-helix protein
MKEDMSFKDKLVEFYEESKENINFKSQLILSLVQSIKEENNQFFSKSKQIKLISLKYL